ncbi:MAG: ABC transporter transmembrane domain-containing protein [Lachnospiraceae bacterium]
MLNKLFYYGKENNKITIASVFVLLLAVLCSVAPFAFIFQIIDKIVSDQNITLRFLLLCALGILIFLVLQALFYGKGLSLSHKAAYGTLMNLRISLQKKLEKLPLGVIEGKGTGTLKKIFVDDIDSLELLLAHGIPEGISNVIGTLVVYFILLAISWKLALLDLINYQRIIEKITKMIKNVRKSVLYLQTGLFCAILTKLFIDVR